MSYELTTSQIARQNILNNPMALKTLEQHLDVSGLVFEGEVVFTKAQAAGILDIDERTIDRYLAKDSGELKANGYKILKGKALKTIKLTYVDDINVVDILDPKAPSLGIFSFRALLNLSMLVTESEKAKAIRNRVLDIVLDVVAQKAGGHTKFINQRDEDYLPSAYMEDSYRKQFTDALRDYLNMSNHKYAVYTDKIYQVVFLGNAAEYKQVLKLAEKDKARETMYSEVLRTIVSFEHGLAQDMQAFYQQHQRKLSPNELDQLIERAANNPYLKPQLEDARIKMASRDLGFRSALHQKLKHYIQSVPQGDFDKFLGEKSRSLEEQLQDTRTLDVLKRLKDR
ncbi:DNA-binding protein [Parashewanella curva]|uniref:DNA-binding protein n=1 Tax=Parashewanella curva TaxID=2338552 RepID=A0A3L8PRV5_9GAMM|nr:DNA-binding protein [Parashewanella curva]RLV58106.1 DNA-binding protein [Parashewanella curva]